MSLAASTGRLSITAICRQRVLPVLTIDDPRLAALAAQGLQTGGLDCAEVTLRTPRALEAIRTMAEQPGLVVGAGTVLTAEQARTAAGAGARFVVSPGFSRVVARECSDLDLAYFPGVATPSEIQAALEEGLIELKFFPAETLGGIAALRALAAPFAGVRFIPTGGITQHSLPDYLALSNVAAVGGSWLAPSELLACGDVGAVVARVRAAVAIAEEAASAETRELP